MSDLYEFVNGIELDPVYVCNPDKSSCRGSELCHRPGGCFYTTDKDRALDPSTPLYMAESLKKVDTGQEPIGRCKDCKFFEYDSVAKVDEIPLIVAHEICQRWGDGCKTREDGYCFLFEPKERSDHEST